LYSDVEVASYLFLFYPDTWEEDKPLTSVGVVGEGKGKNRNGMWPPMYHLMMFGSEGMMRW